MIDDERYKETPMDEASRDPPPNRHEEELPSDEDLLVEPSALRPRVLLVDDSQAVRKALREMLTGAPLYADVIEAQDGSVALRHALEGNFDCVICDLAMPVMDGMTFLRVVRNHRTRLELPVLFLTVKEGLKDKVEGFRNGASDFIVKPFESEELIARVETHVRLQRTHLRTQQLTERLRYLVDTDPLTGVKNRRAFLRALKQETSRAQRHRRPMALLVIDVDRFKTINDRFGHPVGDAVLVALCNALTEGARHYDTVARLGGEEFAVLLPETERSGALVVAERIRNAVRNAQLGPRELERVTVSVGVAFGSGAADDDEQTIMKRADDELYRAKESGRDKVCAEEERPVD